MKVESTISFLFFSYFGVDIKNSKDKFIEVAINKAYADAARHVLKYREDCNLHKEIRKAQREDARKRAIAILKEKLITIHNETKFIRWHREIIKELFDIYNETELEFTGGIAQKWINMTIKNIFVINSVLKMCNDEYEPIELIINNLNKWDIDIPVDDNIITVAQRRGVEVPKNRDDGQRILRWSNWDVEIEEDKYETCYYKEFQEKIRDKFNQEKLIDENLMDVENRLWMEEILHRKIKR